MPFTTNTGPFQYLPPLLPLGTPPPVPQLGAQGGQGAMPPVPQMPTAPTFGTQQGSPLGGQGGALGGQGTAGQSPLMQMVAPYLGYALGQQLAQSLPLFPQMGQATTPAAQPATSVTTTPATTPAQSTTAKTTTPAAATANVPAGHYQSLAAQFATQYGIDPTIFVKQINQESGFDPTAKSGAGAIGIAQIMPDTAKGWGVDPTDPVASLQAAARAMKSYYDSTGSWVGALVSYNAGPGAWQTYQQTGYLPDETKRYIQDILGQSV